MNQVRLNKTKLIFITGGVVSSLGKGIAAASLASLLGARGYMVRVRKLDPYLNIDPGTMSPYQHGEVFVTDDGAETDLDLGHYERFTGINARRGDSITTGQIYSDLLRRERQGQYLGGTVQVIPHVTNLIKEFVLANLVSIDFLICEIGGTVGDIEGLPYFEAIRQLGYEHGQQNVIYIHVTLLPFVPAARELKTKPTQHSVKELRSIGIQPNLLLCRADRHIPEQEKNKIGLFCNVSQENVIAALDQDNIYKVPVAYHNQGFDSQVLKHFDMLRTAKPAELSAWHDIIHKSETRTEVINIALVGKYNQLKDAYKSLTEAFDHAGIALNSDVILHWLDAEDIESLGAEKLLAGVQGIMIPGGFGERGIEGKISAIKYARENEIPCFGICLGMQLMIIEYARHVLGITNASSSEFSASDNSDNSMGSRAHVDGREHIMDKAKAHNVIDLIVSKDELGGTMRLGSYPCALLQQSKIASIYGGASVIYERHRHRFGFNLKYEQHFANCDMDFVGREKNSKMVEAVELAKHPWFIGVQFHPELKSRPFACHPLFLSFVKSAYERPKL